MNSKQQSLSLIITFLSLSSSLWGQIQASQNTHYKHYNQFEKKADKMYSDIHDINTDSDLEYISSQENPYSSEHDGLGEFPHIQDLYPLYNEYLNNKK